MRTAQTVVYKRPNPQDIYYNGNIYDPKSKEVIDKENQDKAEDLANQMVGKPANAPTSNLLNQSQQDYKSHKEDSNMCLGGRDNPPAPQPAPEPPQPVINASPIGDTLAPELQIADEAMDEAAKKKLKKKKELHNLTLNFLSGLNIPATSSGINVA